MCTYCCIGFIDFIFKGNSLTDFFHQSISKKNNDTALNYFVINL